MSDIVKPEDQRSGPPGTCFYCPAKLGEPHGPECVIPQRTVKLRLVVEYETSVPRHWDASQVFFHRNGSSWCLSNAIDDLQKAFQPEDPDDGMGCICSHAKHDVFDDDSGEWLEDSPYSCI